MSEIDFGTPFVLALFRAARGWRGDARMPEAVPWHRVINARGEICLRPTTGYHEQRARLKAEGVCINRAGKIDLKNTLGNKCEFVI